MDSIAHIRIETEKEIEKLIEENEEIQESIKKIRAIADEKIKIIRDEEARKLEEKKANEQRIVDKFTNLGVDAKLRAHVIEKCRYGGYNPNVSMIRSKFFGREYYDDRNPDAYIINKYIDRVIVGIVKENLIYYTGDCYRLVLPVDIPFYKGGKILIELVHGGATKQFEIKNVYGSKFSGTVNGAIPLEFEIDFEAMFSKWDYSHARPRRWDGEDDEDSDDTE